MGANLRIPRLSSSAKADDPVITGLGLGHRFGLNHSASIPWIDDRPMEIAPPYRPGVQLSGHVKATAR